jgi:hypothetical protein
MKTTEIKNAVLDFIKKNPGSNIEQIKAATKTSDILVRGAIKALQNENVFLTAGENGTYSLQSKSQAIVEATTKSEAKTAKKKEEEDLGPKHVPGGSKRDVTRYKFGEHKNLSKGRLAHLLVKTYVEKSPKVTLAKLQEVFHSEELQPRFGVLQEISVSRKHTKNKIPRYFLDAQDVIKLAGGTTIATTNQWTKEGIDKLIRIVAAPPIGIKVKVDSAE